MDKTISERMTEFFTPEIGMFFCGKRLKTRHHVYGPAIRSHFLLVLINEGTARLHRPEGDLSMTAEQLFVIFPGKRVFYEAESDWSIQWVGVAGAGIAQILATLKITPEQPVFSVKNYSTLSEDLSGLFRLSELLNDAGRLARQACLYRFLADLAENAERETPPDPISRARQMIDYNYNNRLEVSSVAAALHLDRSYFSRLFRAETGQSPKCYLREVRMRKAKEYLTGSNTPVKEIAASVGYPDPLYFSTAFRRATGFSPERFRSAHRGTP